MYAWTAPRSLGITSNILQLASGNMSSPTCASSCLQDGGWTQSLGLSLGLSSQKGRKRRSLRDAEAKMEPTEPAGPWPSTTIQEVSRRGSVSPQSQLPNTRDL
ncbi:unnamed protein product [Durusdinium trenchii]|uniref:Uncharacterized protein n=2 Tax=Durusdinium trenchii TaxID=1381693 RepID=A0ABP0PNP7_9DINO